MKLHLLTATSTAQKVLFIHERTAYHAGGTHQSAFREAVARTIKEFYNKNMELTDIRNGIIAAVAIGVEEPVFESQTKTKLGSATSAKTGLPLTSLLQILSRRNWTITCTENSETADILQTENSGIEERKAIAGVTKLARERAKVNLQ